MSKSNIIARILSKNLSGKQTSDKVLGSTEFEELGKVWHMTGQVTPPPVPSNQWPRLHKAMHAGAPKKGSVLPLRKGEHAPGRRIWTPAIRLAAGFLIALTSYWTIQHYFLQTTTVTTANAETVQVTLPDGSVAELNAGTTLTYSKSQRQVVLEGEAFFTVEPGQGEFQVRSGEAVVTVLGTGFNVKGRHNAVTVVVEHGRVAFAGADSSRRVVLQAGELSHLGPGVPPSRPELINLARHLAWREGRLEFERTPLVDAFAELERQFDVKIEYEELDIAGRTLTASFRRGQDFEEVISAACLTFGWTFELEEGAWQIHDND